MPRKAPPDYDEFQPKEAPDGSAARMKFAEIAEKFIEAKQAVAEAEEFLKSAKERLRQVEEEELPDAMAEANISEFKLEDGSKIAVRDFIIGSLPKDDEARIKALAWVEDHDGAELIRTQVSMKFGVKEHNVALDLAEQLRERGYDVTTDHGIHPQSLYAWARELLRDGKDVDFELLGLTPGRKAFITAPRAKKQ